MNPDLYTTYTRANLPAVLRKFTRDQHLIDEISQAVYLAVLERCKDHAQSSTVTYFRVSAINKWNDELRHRYRHQRLLDFLEYEFDEADYDECNSTPLEVVREVLSKLPLHYQQVLTLKLEGFDLTETANAMDIDRDKARQLRTCAMRRLKQQLFRDSN